MFTASCGYDDGEVGQVEGVVSALFPLERQLVKDLYGVGLKGRGDSQWSHSDAPWTYEVKQRLHGLGQKQGYLVYPEKVTEEDREKFKGEWMLDVVWVDVPKAANARFDWQRTRGLKLACECEWGTSKDAILTDFLKLTWTVCDLRLLIYNASAQICAGDQERRDIVEVCKDACPLSRGFRYLVVGIGRDVFRVDAWIA